MFEICADSHRRPGWIAALIVSIFCIAASGQDGGTQQTQDRFRAEEKLIEDKANQETLRARRSALSEYWLGVDGIPADETLRSQLELPDGQGLMLNQVVENSPAAKAGLKQHDVLLIASDKPLAQTSDLAAVIQDKKEQSFSIKLIRRGRQITIEAKAERRPASETGETCPSISDVDDSRFVRRVYLDLLGKDPSEEEAKQFQNDKQADKRSRLVNRLLRVSTVANKSCTACHAPTDRSAAQLLEHVYHSLSTGLDVNVKWEPVNTPAVVLDETQQNQAIVEGQANNVTLDMFIRNQLADAQVELPDDLTITITHRGKQPARVSVQKSDVQSWETTADKLDQLPDDVRGFAEKLLGVKHPSMRNRLRYWMLDTGRHQPIDMMTWRAISAHEAPKTATAPDPNAAAERLEQQLDKLKAEYEEVRKAVQELRKSLPPEAPKTESGEKK